MTSVPINRSGYLMGPNEKGLAYYVSDPSRYPSTLGPWSRYLRGFRETKPASTRTLKTASGWRNPTAYYRNHDESTLHVSGNALLYRYVKGNAPQYRDMINLYPDGILWDVQRSNSAPLFPNELEERNVIKALLKLKGVNGGVNLSVMFAERKEAAELMTSSVERIAKQVKKFKSHRPKDWAKVVRHQLGYNQVVRGGDIPNSWLELQYGWLPSMSDVFASSDALNKRERDGDAYRATIKSSVSSSSSTLQTVATHHYGNSTLLMGLRGPFEVKHSSFIHLDFELENPVLATLASLGITNPAELIWEKLPYSFVVDWFAPVGDYLSAFDAALGWRFKAGTKSRCTRYSIVAKPYLDSVGGTDVVGFSSNDTYTRSGISLTRDVLLSSPLPRFPGIKNPLSTGHIANGLSLLVSAFR